MDILNNSNRAQISLANKKQRALVCYICGKEYGTKRIEKHLVLC
jgi:hypothetical protein